MKITDVKVHLIKTHRTTKIPSPWILVQVFTDEGLIGLGDATNWPGGTIIKQAVHELSRLAIGQDPFHIERLYHRMYHNLQQIGQTGAVIAAISGIEIALWDIVGQALGRPIYDLIGGPVRDQVRLYSHASTPERCGQLAEKGYTAIKAYFPVGPRPSGEHIGSPRSVTVAEELSALKHLKACRKVVGNAVDLCVDAQARYTVSAAIRMGRRLEEVGLLFFEEPVGPENIAALAKVRDAVNVPICEGERQYTRFGFRDMIAAQAVDMIMPDIVRCGGIMETKKIAAMAESYYMHVSPHNPNSPVSTMASLHVMANIPNGLLLEHVDEDHDAPWRNDILSNPPVFDNGFMQLPTEPGLGTKLVMKEAEKYRFEG
ncbi:MAG: mandelate racemase/muconate lactonizing enzyme family protein [Anaerolineae bacterium]|nr:mandelate racemase/muconate lactonizing enzyme family protein [Anaerolineae bacterium]